MTAGSDRTARIWDAKTGQLLDTANYDGALLHLEFSPDSQRVVILSTDGAVYVWDVHLETRSPAEIAKLVAERVPWKLEGGVLVPRD